MLLRAGYDLRVDEPTLVGFGCCGFMGYEVQQIDFLIPLKP
jgi:hypothetical protein